MQLQINGSMPIITTNFEAIKLQLQGKLSQYSLIVSEDDVAVAKKSATEINALKGEIDSLRKTKVKEFSAPIDAFDAKAKELVGMCDKARQELLAQVATFEDKKRAECLVLLQEELQSQYKKFGISDEFKTVKVEDLAIVSNLNKSGISKKASDTIEERVLKVLEHQKAIDSRLLQLEGVCLKNGLAVAFSREHINHFLMIENNAIYEQKLLGLIQSELKRQEQVKVKAENDAIAKVKAHIEASLPKTPEIKVQHVQPIQPIKPIQQKNRFDIKSVQKTGVKKRFKVTATFEIETDEGFEPYLEAMLLDKFEAACIKTMPEITVTKYGDRDNLGNYLGLKEGSLF